MNIQRVSAAAVEILSRKNAFLTGTLGNQAADRKRAVLNSLFNPYPLYEKGGKVKRMTTKAQFLRQYDRPKLRQILGSLQAHYKGITFRDTPKRALVLYLATLSHPIERKYFSQNSRGK